MPGKGFEPDFAGEIFLFISVKRFLVSSPGPNCVTSPHITTRSGEYLSMFFKTRFNRYYAPGISAVARIFIVNTTYVGIMRFS